MLTILATTGRVLARHWPALLAWYLAGILVNYWVTELAGFVGAYNSTIALLILPIAVLARLVSMVGMLLVLRDGLRALQAVAPLPESAVERRRTFLTALLASILPFFAVYAAQGLLNDDVQSYALKALEKTREEIGATLGTDRTFDPGDNVLDLSVSVWTVSVIVVAFAARWAWGRWSDRMPKVLSLLAVYCEVVWVFFSLILLGDFMDSVNGWVDTRVAMGWVADARETVSGWFAPFVWLGDGIGWLLSQAGPVLLAPLSWLTVAGVVYGQAIVAEKLSIQHKLVAQMRERAARVPNPVMRRLRDLGTELGSRFVPIWRAILLMWRAGPVIIASYALLYTAVIVAESWLRYGESRLIGPHDLDSFWSVYWPVIYLLPPLIIEPIRLSLIAGAYDTTFGMLRRAQDARTDADAPATSEEADAAAITAAAGGLPTATLPPGAPVPAAAQPAAPPA
ncbi:hypothetical protein DY023_01230 [Microbacterium bovistercoris]|uniref:Uncharacterized protein n=1 Tax=Microbacterium bovistercoris TaxID=2293570 RepID=A0A371NY25_9MICO|nr:hypothetical protein [Microbacterium bovistercoris]REJ08383.1 hypothetical protein DY023_01230 [Microbacterium bovistercoris]